MVCDRCNTFPEHPCYVMKCGHPAYRAGRHQVKFSRRGQYGGPPARFARRSLEEGDHERSIRRSNLHVADLGDKLQLSVDFPGVKAADLNVQVEDRILMISGNRSVPSEEGVRAVEYVRRFRLDESIDAENLSANLADGVLVLTAQRIQKAGPINVAVTTNATPGESEDTEDDDVVLVDVQEGATTTEGGDGDKKPAAADSTAETKDSSLPENEKESEAK